VDAYLDMAEAILRAEKRPLSPQAIIAAAYRNGLVPTHLHGKTQHKTLQARLSEDIINRREHSAFFRTAPGRFFLREFLADVSVPEEFRRPVPTRRRIRELVRGPALAIDWRELNKIVDENATIRPEKLLPLLRARRYRYEDPRNEDGNSVFLRSFVCVRRDQFVLTYRLGRFRDDRDAFVSKRSLGFSALVHVEDHTLFNLGDLGIVDSGVRATKIDLDIPDVNGSAPAETASLAYFLLAHQGSKANDLLAVIRFECPEWFEPVKRRLALNDLAWMDLSQPVNNVDDFDPWSRAVLLASYRAVADHHVEAAT
jgi:HB1, ASXL, restriction endonuclease HTH domain